MKEASRIKAFILLDTNPGSEDRATGHLEKLNVPGVAITGMMHVFGRVDGVVICEADSLTALGRLGEALRRNGVFHTETLISIED